MFLIVNGKICKYNVLLIIRRKKNVCVYVRHCDDAIIVGIRTVQLLLNSTPMIIIII